MDCSRRSVLSLLTVMTLAAASVFPQAPLQLKYGFEKGKAYRYADLVTSTMVQEMMGQEMKIYTTARMVSRIEVEEKREDGASVLVTSMDSLVVATKSPRRDTTMVMEELIGKRNRVVLSPLGVVESRQVLDSVKSIQGMGRSAAFREAIRFHQLSKGPVAMGGKWKTAVADTNDAMGGAMVSTSSLEYTVVGREQVMGHPCIKLTYVGESTIEGKGSMMGMEVFTEGKGKLKGTIFFDDAQGLVVMEEGQNDTDMTAAITGQQNMTIPMTQSAKVSRTLMPAAEAVK
jgi:hypothetical protein